MEPELTAQESALLELVPKDGSNIGNIRLLRTLAWAEEKYWEVRNKLLERGILATERGRGGSVCRVVNATVESTPSGAVPPATPSYDAESALYQPMASVIQNSWTKDYRIDDFVLEITAKQGRRDTGGTWTRPDVVVVSVSTYLFVPGKHLDVTTFEIKPSDALDVTAVYEALAHLRAATRAFVVLHVPKEAELRLRSTVDDIVEEANRHGVGLIVAQNPDDYETWDFRVESIRREADPMKLNDFIAKQLSPESKLKLQKWCR